MEITCKCGRLLKVGQDLAGQKIKCQACGQKYRLPPLNSADSSIQQMSAWEGKPEKAEKKVHNPADVGAVVLGESISLSWLLASVLITLFMIASGIYSAKYVFTALIQQQNVKEYANYLFLGMYWGPSLAFVISGWIVARFSPGRTIAEPALGATLAMAIFAGLFLHSEFPVAKLLVGADMNILNKGNLLLKLNLFLLALFNAACLACAGAYFGEVAQERHTI